MKTFSNDLARLQNAIDGLEKLVLESRESVEEVDSVDHARTKVSMQHIFAASAARAKLALDSSGQNELGRSSPKPKRQNPLAFQIMKLTALLSAQPDLEPRLRAVFDSSPEVDDAEMDKVIDDIGKILSEMDNAPKKAKSKDPKGS